MSPNPPAFIEHLRQHGYHPRSDKHSNALCEAIVDDLVRGGPQIARRASDGRLVYDLNFTISAGTSDWNVDLVLGAPPPGSPPPEGDAAIRKTLPSTVQIAIEVKSVMTEHRKAVKNRTRDLEAHHEHVHRYNNRTIAAGVLVVNQAETLKSPLRPRPTVHRDPKALVEHCIMQMRSITSRPGLHGEGLEAKAVLVVDVDNQDLSSARFVCRPPAPSVGDPLHYDAFLQAVAGFYVDRFC
ncbi:MAG: hypothetical protein ACOC8A_01190 [bacterium]